MRYVSIDIETTGLDLDLHQVIEFGAVIEDTEKPTVGTSLLPSFRAVILRPSYNVTPYCMGLHAGLFSEIQNVGGRDPLTLYLDPCNLQRAFLGFLRDHALPGKVIVAGKNFFAFDYKFLGPLLPDVEWDYRSLDPSVLYVRPSDERPPSLPECCLRAGMGMAGYHTAVGDARMVIDLIRRGTK